MSSQTRRRYLVGMVVTTAVAVVIAVIVNVVYTQHVQNEAEQRSAELRVQQDRRWCALLTTLDTPSPRPSTARGREMQRQIGQLRVDLGCER